MTAGLYPSLTDARRSHFQAAIAATHRTGYLKPPTVLWDMLDEAVITIQCEAHDPVAAAETASSIIRRNAEYVALLGVVALARLWRRVRRPVRGTPGGR
jgi:hypothetical protein